jgi:hypothetical protein
MDSWSFNRTAKQLTLNPSAASAPNCGKEHVPTESADYVQGKRTKLHERAPNSKANRHQN